MLGPRHLVAGFIAMSRCLHDRFTRLSDTDLIMPKKTIVRFLIGAAVPLLIPFVGMQFRSDWNWGPGDFVFAWLLFVGAGIAYKLATRNAASIAYRAAAAVAVATAFVLTWVNLAVGIIGNDDNPANLMYVGVVAVGIIGAAIARFHPHGMARTLFTMALALAAVPVIALLIRRHDFSPGVMRVFVLNGCFVLLLLASAWLFRKAASELNETGRPALD